MDAAWLNEGLIYLGALTVAWHLHLNAWQDDHQNFFVALWTATEPSMEFAGRIGVLVGLAWALRARPASLRQ